MKKAISLIILAVVALFLVQKYGNTSETKYASLEEKMYAADHDRSILKEDNFEDLYMLGQLYNSDATLKKDVNDPSYKEDQAKAEEYFIKAKEMEPNNPHSYRGLALIYYFNDQDKSRFIQNADKALELQYNYFDIPFLYGEMLFNEGKIAESKPYLQKAKDIMDDLINTSDASLKDTPQYKQLIEMLSATDEKSE